MKYLKFVGLLFLVLSTQVTLGQVPQTMSYQGVLVDADGNTVVDGKYNLTFKLYDVTEGGDTLWQESQEIDSKGGIFSVILGSINPLDLLFDQQYWLGISIGNESELVPRIALTSSPYALRARSVAGGVNSFPAEGNVGIGVENPTEALEVEGNIRVSEKILAGAFSSTSPFIIEAPEGTERVRIDDNTGWVGIGTPNPGRNLEIYSEEDRGVGIIINNPNPNDGITRSIEFKGPGEMNAGIISYGPNRPNVGNHLQIANQHGPSSVISFVINGGESMRILDNGVVGIGERDPQAKLHIGGLPWYRWHSLSR